MTPDIPKEELTEMEIKILNHLEQGHNKAISLRNLALRTGMSERKVRMTIEQLRREQWAILIPASAPFGYFLAQNQEELSSYIHYMKSRMIEEYKTYRIVKNATIRKFQKTVQLPLGV
jgi:biotin operon repressor